MKKQSAVCAVALLILATLVLVGCDSAVNYTQNLAGRSFVAASQEIRLDSSRKPLPVNMVLSFSENSFTCKTTYSIPDTWTPEEKKEADTKGKELNFSGTYTYNLGLVELKFNPAMTEHGQHSSGQGASTIEFRDFTLLGGEWVKFTEPEHSKKISIYFCYMRGAVLSEVCYFWDSLFFISNSLTFGAKCTDICPQTC